MTRLGDAYSDFSLIDLDAQGGYARVAQARYHEQASYQKDIAFKIMRHNIDYKEGISRFEGEIKLLSEITNDKSAPSAIAQIHDSGFAPIDLAKDFEARKVPSEEYILIKTGKNIEEFLHVKSVIQEKQPNRWLPYIVTELASYDDSLLRQIHNQPKNDLFGLFRLPTGEVIIMALQLLNVMEYLHQNHRRAYVDWKPEHIFWNGLRRTAKLIDWNVTVPFDDGPGESQNIRDDIRLFTGAVLYVSLTFVDPDFSSRFIGPRPTTNTSSPIPEIRKRYWTDNPDFHQHSETLDERIKNIIRIGLDPQKGFSSVQELRSTLIEYAQQELGLSESEITLRSEPSSDYLMALVGIRHAQKKLLQAQQYLIEAVKTNGKKVEFTRTFDAIKKALKNFPAS